MMFGKVRRGLFIVSAVGGLAACAVAPPPPPPVSSSLVNPAASVIEDSRASFLSRIASDRSAIAESLTDAAVARTAVAAAAQPLDVASPRFQALLALLEPMAAQEKDFKADLLVLAGLRDSLKAGGPLAANLDAMLTDLEIRAGTTDQRRKALYQRASTLIGLAP